MKPLFRSSGQKCFGVPSSDVDWSSWAWLRHALSVLWRDFIGRQVKRLEVAEVAFRVDVELPSRV